LLSSKALLWSQNKNKIFEEAKKSSKESQTKEKDF